MGFEPLDTDERVERVGKQRQPKSDFEAQLMGGCVTIVVTSFLCYFLTIWPWFIFPTYSVTGLVTSWVAGSAPAIILGSIAAFRFRTAGVAGMMGGVLAASVFVFLVLNQVGLGRVNPDLPTPEYPERWQWMVPLINVVITGFFAAIFRRKEPVESLAVK